MPESVIKKKKPKTYLKKTKQKEKLPYSIRVLLESAVRNCDEFNVKSSDVENILAWEKNAVK